MKKIVISGWNVRRLLYMIMGMLIVVQSVRDHQNWGIVLGAYFAVMAVFNIGCASGYCGVPITGKKQDIPVVTDAEYEEIK